MWGVGETWKGEVKNGEVCADLFPIAPASAVLNAHGALCKTPANEFKHKAVPGVQAAAAAVNATTTAAAAVS